MENGTDSRLDTIRKLLAKAENPAATEHERDAFNKKAFELMARYGIDQALLAEDAPGRDQVDNRFIDIDQPYALEKSGLLWAVASALRCKGVRHPGRAHQKFHLFGMASDLDRVELLYTSLLVQVSHGLAVTRPEHPGESVAAYRRSWVAGFSLAVGSRLREAEARAADQHRTEHDTARSTPAAQGPGRALAVVFADRDQQVAEAFAVDYPTTRTARTRRLSGSGRYAGYAAGQRADLGGSRLGGKGNRSIRG